jgi:multidrug efflux pump subunit AcrA (membrane-fusion protein)
MQMDKPFTRYRCPMHPQFIRDVPGSCGICGMNLVPFTVDPNEGKSPVEGLSIVKMDTAERVRSGIRTVLARRAPFVRHIRMVGRIAVDEQRTSHIHTKVSGWVRKLHVDYTGQTVRRGDPVLDIYSPELVTAQSEYLIAFRSRSGQSEIIQAVRQRLALLDMTDAQIRRLEETGVSQESITLYAPNTGTVIEKNVNEGFEVNPAMTLYSIADLRTVWVLADAYESDLPHIRVGQTARVVSTHSSGDTLIGRVSFISPVLDPATRTASIRLEFTNRRGALRPGAFVDVTTDAPLGEKLVVPLDGVLDSGARKIVFVENTPGTFEPREVRLGVREGDLVEIVDGLQAGDRVVSGAAFLLDSESQLRAATNAMSGHQH